MGLYNVIILDKNYMYTANRVMYYIVSFDVFTKIK